MSARPVLAYAALVAAFIATVALLDAQPLQPSTPAHPGDLQLLLVRLAHWVQGWFWRG